MLDNSEHQAAPALGDLMQAASRSLDETRDIVRRYEAASRDLRHTISRSKQLREESAALRAALESMTPGAALPDRVARLPVSS